MRRARCALLAASLAVAPAARAQDPAPATVPPPPVAADTLLPIPAVDGLRVREGRLTYRMQLTLDDGTARPAGTRVVAVVPTLYAGGAAWALAEVVEGMPTEVRDSLVLQRHDLLPLHWEGVRGPARFAAEVARDTLYAAATWPTGRRTIVSGIGGPVLAGGAMLEAMVALLPLEPGWRGLARLLLVDLAGARTLPVTLAVEGVESVQVEAGRFDCWVVAVYGDRVEERLWIRRDAPVVVRRTQRVPFLAGATLESSLVRDERR